MRVLQIVTYISPDGAYGGPVRVALNQSKALRDLGHDVTVSASAGGFEGTFPQFFDDFPVQLFSGYKLLRKGGFAGLSAPAMLHWLFSALKNADVVHIHLARDLVTLPAAVITLLSGKALVVQTHGMIDPTSKMLARPIDLFLTRPVLRRARAIFYLTEQERTGLIKVAPGNLKLVPLLNGINAANVENTISDTLQETAPEILYLARLHPRKRPLTFVSAAIDLLRSGVSASFRLVGPDEGEATSVQQKIANASCGNKLAYEGALAPQLTRQRIAACDIYVLPSVDEPFPMTVLEAMASGKPVIVTRSCGLAPYVEAWNAGIVVDESKEALVDAIRTLVQEPKLRVDMGEQAKRLVQKEFRIDVVSRRLAKIYEEVK